MDVLPSRQNLVHRTLNIRVEVHRIDDRHVIASLGDLPQREADPPEALAEVLPAVTGNEDHPGTLCQVESVRLLHPAPDGSFFLSVESSTNL